MTFISDFLAEFQVLILPFFYFIKFLTIIGVNYSSKFDDSVW